ncbi:MAG: protein kinase [Acidobacteriota bacterium]|nr:protein kinase [Acidobacteriota bacterium]
MGVVYHAHDEQLDRDVALKVLGERWLTDEKARARLLQEARTASALNHPHVCTIYEVAESDGETYIAMEYVAGRPLSALVPGEGLPTETLLRYALQISDALAHAHQRRVIHRDLKCANVVITPEGRAKVLDFGLAKRLREEDLNAVTRSQMSLTEAGVVVGTLHYLAPEVLRGQPADERSDLWALGVMLYEMATGQPPFHGKTSFELTSGILREPPEPFPERVPSTLRGVIQRCLVKEPGERYQSAVEVRAALETLQSSAGVPAVVRAGKAPRRLWLWPVAIGLLLIGAGIIAAVIRGVPFNAGRRGIAQQEAPAAPRLSTGGPPSKNAEANEYFERAMLFLYHQYDYDRARLMLEHALGIDPHFAEARAWYGFTYFLKLDSGASNDTTLLYKAEEELRHALQDEPNLASAHSSLAAVYVEEGRKELAPGEIEKALRANPLHLDSYIELGYYHVLNGDYTAAMAAAKQASERDPLFFVAHLMEGDILRLQGDKAGSIRVLGKVVEQDPNNTYAMVPPVRAYLDAGDLAQARRTLESARKEYRANYQLRLVWAQLLALEGKRAAALKEMDGEVLKYAAANPYMTAYAAEFYAVLGEKGEVPGLAGARSAQRRRSRSVVPPRPVAGERPQPSPLPADPGIHRLPPPAAGRAEVAGLVSQLRTENQCSRAECRSQLEGARVEEPSLAEMKDARAARHPHTPL